MHTRQVWLITGATGTLGQSLVDYLLRETEDVIRCYSRNELNQVAMKRLVDNARVRFLIGDVRERDRLKRALTDVDYVIHCAALKHVDICEYNPIEAVRTNIDGSINVIECALDLKITKVIAISSDKAVMPINIYGATKLVEEKVFVNANLGSKYTKFSCVRFGNFFASSGSVFPLWYEQSKTGTIKLTDPDMQRYFINLGEASKFVFKCVNMMQGGEIFIPEMQKYTMLELAKKYYPQCIVEYIGSRPGEKLDEAMYSEYEKPEKKDGYWVC